MTITFPRAPPLAAHRCCVVKEKALLAQPIVQTAAFSASAASASTALLGIILIVLRRGGGGGVHLSLSLSLSLFLHLSLSPFLFLYLSLSFSLMVALFHKVLGLNSQRGVKKCQKQSRSGVFDNSESSHSLAFVFPE
jgi:hypothetical protein